MQCHLFLKQILTEGFSWARISCWLSTFWVVEQLYYRALTYEIAILNIELCLMCIQYSTSCVVVSQTGFIMNNENITGQTWLQHGRTRKKTLGQSYVSEQLMRYSLLLLPNKWICLTRQISHPRFQESVEYVQQRLSVSVSEAEIMGSHRAAVALEAQVPGPTTACWYS